ncbi:MAG: hypothetical protein ACO3UX_12140 [Candidatus Nanopelagicales bacterium]
MTPDQMAAALRALGWTCTPPDPAAPTRRARVEREITDVLCIVWRVGAMEQVLLRTAAPRHTFRRATPAETCADLARWLLCAPMQARANAWVVIEAKAPQAANAISRDAWRALIATDAEAVAAWLDAPDDVTPE